jgi:hypothetical protein
MANISTSWNPGLSLSMQVSMITILRKLVITGDTSRLSDVDVQRLSVAC